MLLRAFELSLVRHFTAGNPRYISPSSRFGRFAPHRRVRQENNPKQH
jgi:hypothetical protein